MSGYEPTQWQGGGHNHDFHKSHYQHGQLDGSSHYDKGGYANRGYENKLNAAPMPTGKISDAPQYVNQGYANKLNETAFDSRSAYGNGGYDMRPAYQQNRTEESKYTFPALIRQLNDTVHELSKSLADLGGISQLNDNEIREMQFDIYRYISKHFSILVVLSIIAAFAVVTVQIWIAKMLIFAFTLGLYWFVLTWTSSVLVEGEKNVFTELGKVTFTVYEAYAKPFRQYVSFAFFYILAWFILFLLPLSFGATYFVEALRFSDFLYVPISFILDYRQLDFVDFFSLACFYASIVFWSKTFLKKTEIDTEHERKKRLENVYARSGKFDDEERAKHRIFGDEFTGIDHVDE